MRKILFLLLSIGLLYSCSNEMIFDADMVDTSPTTRTADADKIYYLGSSDSADVAAFVFTPKPYEMLPFARTLRSYIELDGVRTSLQPEIVSKPSWVDYCICSQYNDIYVLMVAPTDNTSSERSGTVVLRQPESDKMLSVSITQNGINNNISIGVTKTYKNQYVYTATAHYPVKGETRVRVPLVVYNDGGELTHEAVIVISKGERTGSYIMDWNASPLVAYHGDLKGYRLYEGSIYGEDTIYTYGFVRYW